MDQRRHIAQLLGPNQKSNGDSSRPQAPKIAQLKASVPPVRKPPPAPPVYRPQPGPKVLQTKKGAARQLANQAARLSTAPPVYRPQSLPKVLQTKTSANGKLCTQQSDNGVAPRSGPQSKRGALQRLNPGDTSRSGTVQRAITNPFQMPDIFRGPVPPIYPGSFFSAPIATPVEAVSSPSALPKPVEKPQEKPKRVRKAKAKPVSLSEFVGKKNDTMAFAALGGTGELEAWKITFSQFTCGSSFTNSFTLDDQVMRTVWDLDAKLQEKPDLYTHTPAIRITLYKDRIMSVDNRRLKAHQMAGVKIRFIKKDYESLTAHELGHIDHSAPSENLNLR